MAKKINFKNLSYDTIATFIVLMAVLVPLGILSAVSIYSSSYFLTNIISTELKNESFLVAYDIESFITERIRDAKIISKSSELERDDIPKIIQYLTEITQADKWINDIDVVSLEGLVMASSGVQHEQGRLFWKLHPISQDLFISVTQAKQGDVFVSEAISLDSGNALLFMTPITDETNTKVIRILVLEINLEHIHQIMSHFDKGIIGETHVYIVDNNGKVIISDNPAVGFLADFPDIKVQPTLLSAFSVQGDVGSIIYTDVAGDEVMAGHADIDEFGVNKALDWSIIAIAPLDAITLPVNNLKKMLFALGLIIAFISMLVMSRIVKIFNNKIKKLATQAEKISMGVYSSQPHEKIKRKGAITDLAVAINKMEVNIKQQILETNEREQNLTVTLNSIADAVIATDAKGNVIRMNPTAEQLTGWTFFEAQGLPIKTLMPMLDTISREVIENPVDQVLATGEIVHSSNKVTLISKDGTEYQITNIGAPIRGLDNLILGMVLTFNNITEQQRLLHILESLASLSTGNDLDTFLSDSLMSLSDFYGTKYAFVGELLPCGKRIRTLSVLGGGKKIENFEYDLEGTPCQDILNCNMELIPHSVSNRYAKDKMLVDMEIESYFGVPLSTLDGKTMGLIALMDTKPMSINTWSVPLLNVVASRIAREIERKQTEEKLQITDKALRLSQKMDALGKLTGGIAHDFNNALGIIIGYSGLLLAKIGLDKKSTGYVDEIRKAGERSKKLTAKLLSFARYEKPMQKEENINDILKEEQGMLEKLLTVRIELVLNLCESPWAVWIDSSAFEDVILNMSINAMHAMPDGGSFNISTSNETISLETEAEIGLDPGEYVKVSLKDSGIGMSLTVIQKIFDPFFSTKGDGGTGLGMSQVYGFMKQSDGGIDIYSKPDKGALFNLYFPRYISNSNKDKSDDKEDLNSQIIGSETVLIVDDEEALLRLSEELLSSHGYNVLTALNGHDALDILESQSIDLLITDVIMPKMDGNQLVAIALEKNPDLKVQMVSGYTDHAHAQLVDNNIHIRRIQKPYSNEKFLLAARELLDSD